MSEPPRSHRRDFLKGKTALDALSSLSPLPVDPNTETFEPTGATYLIEVSRTAMACQFDIVLNAGRSERIEQDAPERAVQALDLLDVLEDQLSVYRDHSEVSAINRAASVAPLKVEPGLFELLRLAATISESTQGAFDITSSPLSKAWGFWRRAGRLPSAEELTTALSNVGWQRVHLHAADRTVSFDKSGVEINLNAIGKGYALDRCAELLLGSGTAAESFSSSSVVNFLIHGGQSSVLARGSRAGFEGWTVTLRNPLRPEQRLIEFCLRDQALGTSGTGTQFFYQAGKRYGHVLDPRTGIPADQVLSATVVAATAAEADALATAFYVLGWDATAAYCSEHPGVGALLVLPGQRHGGIEIHAVGLDPDTWRRLDADSGSG